MLCNIYQCTGVVVEEVGETEDMHLSGLVMTS